MDDAVAAYRNDADRHGHCTEQRTEGVCFDPGHGPQAICKPYLDHGPLVSK